jgi:DNA-directed RNA polymerase specialized sigma24 family protein
MSPRRRERALVRPHVVTDGRAHPTRNVFDLVTLVTVVNDRKTGPNPEKRRIVRLCRGGALSVAEVASHLDLPVGIVKVLLSDLVDSGHISIQAPGPETRPADSRLLQEVLDGLRARL